MVILWVEVSARGRTFFGREPHNPERARSSPGQKVSATRPTTRPPTRPPVVLQQPSRDLAASHRSAWRRFRPIHYEARTTSSADQPDSISHIRNIVPWRNVGTIEAPVASRADCVGPADDCGADVFHFIGFELFGHMNEISRVRLGLTICLEPRDVSRFKASDHVTGSSRAKPGSAPQARPCPPPLLVLNTMAERRVFTNR